MSEVCVFSRVLLGRSHLREKETNQTSNHRILFPIIIGKGIQAEDVCSAASAETGRLLRAFPNGRENQVGCAWKNHRKIPSVNRSLQREDVEARRAFFNPELSVPTWRPPPDGRGWRCLDANGAHMALRCGQEAGCG